MPYFRAMSQGRRQLATVLFLDIVASTSLAARIGDARYKELQSRFYRIVRGELKRFAGHEEDTAGDGFFATFASPTQAVRCACAAATAVRELGVEIRAGLHTGETELVDGKAGGIAVVIGSRVMSLAHAGEVLVTSTTKDLVAGSGLEFEDFSAHELKGVPGTWQVFAVTAIDGQPIGRPLEATEAAARLEAIEPTSVTRRSRRPLIALGAVAIALVLVAGAGFAGIGPFQREPVTSVLLVDPATNTIISTVKDGLQSLHHPQSIYLDGSNLWQATFKDDEGGVGRIIRRDPATGVAATVSPLDTGDGMGFGFGYGWVAHGSDPTAAKLSKIDPASATVQATIDLPGEFADANSDATSLWYLSASNDLVRIDPNQATISASYRLDANEPRRVVPLADSIWICDCEHQQILRFDPVAGQVTGHFDIASRSFIIGASAPDSHEIWLFDQEAATLTPLDSTTGQAGRPLGIAKRPYDAKIGFGSIWVAAGSSLYRFPLTGDGGRQEIAMPPGTSAGGLALDEAHSRVWVENCGCPDG